MFDLSSIIGKYVDPKNSNNSITISYISNMLSLEVNEENKNLLQRVILDDTWLPVCPYFAKGENCGGGWTRKGDLYYEISVDILEEYLVVSEQELVSSYPIWSDKRIIGNVRFDFQEEELVIDDNRFTQSICFRTVKKCDGDIIEFKKYVKSSNYNESLWQTKTVSPIDIPKINEARKTETGSPVAMYPDLYPQDVSDLFV